MLIIIKIIRKIVCVVGVGVCFGDRRGWLVEKRWVVVGRRLQYTLRKRTNTIHLYVGKATLFSFVVEEMMIFDQPNEFLRDDV